MKQTKISYCILSILSVILCVGTIEASAISVNEIEAVSAQSLFSEAMAVWHFNNMDDCSGRNNTLKLSGQVKIGVELKSQEYKESLKRGGDGKAAIFDRNGSFSIEANRVKNLRPSGEALSVCARVKLSGPGALFFSDFFL